MGADDGPRHTVTAPVPEADGEDSESRSGGRFRRGLGSSGAMIRIVWRDPEHLPERLTLYAADRLAEPSRAWAEHARETRPDTPRSEIASDLRSQSAAVARVDGAVSGTPFFIALVPGYMAYLWQEARMGLRTAALYGHDPASLRTSAEMLALRGVHPSPEAAAESLDAVIEAGPPEKPNQRRSLRTWAHSVYLLLVFGGFIGAKDNEAERTEVPHARLRAVAGVAVGAAIWLSTWVFPVTLMVAMAWGCETHARQLGRRLLAYYDGEAATEEAAIAAADRSKDEGHDKRAILRTAVLGLSVIVPIVFVAYADHIKNTTGINWIGALGALVALSIVITVTVLASRK